MSMTYGAPLRVIAAEIIRPALHAIGIWSQARECLVLGTGAHESGYRYLQQLGGGPALGWFQCERLTHDDMWKNWLSFRPVFAQPLNQLRNGETSHMALIRYPLYAAALCGLHYQRKQQGYQLPPQDDAPLQAAYHKKYYNTAAGKTDPAKSVIHFQHAIEATK
jgi:hypothetical protein